MQVHLFRKCTRTRLLLISAKSPPSVKAPFLTRSLSILPLKSARYPASTAARFTLRLQASRAARFNLRLQSPRYVPYSKADASRCQRATRPAFEPFLSEIEFDMEYQLPIFMYFFSWQVAFWPMISPFKIKPLKSYKTSSELKTLFVIYVTKTFVHNLCESFFSLVFNFRDSPCGLVTKTNTREKKLGSHTLRK